MEFMSQTADSPIAPPVAVTLEPESDVRCGVSSGSSSDGLDPELGAESAENKL